MLGIAALCSHAAAQAARSRAVAITIDDVPWTGGNRTATARQATAQMISALRLHHAPVAVFVNCGRLGARDSLLAQWLAAGATVGNHTAYHSDLNTAPLAEWLADVRSCDTTLRAATHQPVRYFRFPMLHEGPSTERLQAARSLLHELHYQNAHVTIDNSDFIAVQPYSASSVRGDAVAAGRIAAAALEHDLAATRHFEEVARRKIGRDVAQVILLHANAMTAAIIGPLLDSLTLTGYRFVTLEAALADSVYQGPTCYIGTRGLSFLYRVVPCAAAAVRWDVTAETQLRNRLPRP
jgi:peptidoglycan/xylan/chitin deacetylase (PgdA/CDA1 family)